MILNTLTASATETYICYGKEETYHCTKYNGGGPGVYNYSQYYYSNNITVHEFGDSGTRNPYAPPDESSEEITEIPPRPTPVFIPYDPNFLFQLTGR